MLAAIPLFRRNFSWLLITHRHNFTSSAMLFYPYRDLHHISVLLHGRS